MKKLICDNCGKEALTTSFLNSELFKEGWRSVDNSQVPDSYEWKSFPPIIPPTPQIKSYDCCSAECEIEKRTRGKVYVALTSEEKERFYYCKFPAIKKKSKKKK